MSQFPWMERLNELGDTLQVDLLNKTILNIMPSFVPNKTIRIKPLKIKNMLRKQNRKYKNYKNNGFREVDRIIFDQYRKECKEEIEKSKQNYVLILGTRLADENTDQKTYWKLLIIY